MIRYPCVDCGVVVEKKQRLPIDNVARCADCYRKFRSHKAATWNCNNKGRKNLNNKAYLERHKEEVKKRKSEKHRANPDKQKEYDLRRHYGIILEEYRRREEEQKGLCAICGNKPGRKGLVVDHCHSSGRVRGLLCSNCNVCLGFLGDTLRSLEDMVCKFERYLIKVENSENPRTISSPLEEYSFWLQVV